MIMTQILACIKQAKNMLWLLLPVILGACSLLPESSPVTFYRLPPPPVVTPQEPVLQRAVTLRVNRPETSGLLSGNRIAVIPQQNQLSAYQGARWAASVPVLFRDQLIDTWQQQAGIQHIISDSEALQAGIELRGTLRAFHTEYRQGKPVVVIHFDAQLVDPADRRLVASRRFATLAAPATDEVPDVVTAFGMAQARLSSDMLDWILMTMETRETRERR